VSGPGGVLEVLRGVDLFEELSEDCLRRIAASAREERLAAGDWVVREGGRVEWFGVLTDGMVDWVKMVDGRELVMASRSAPTYFGAMNLLTEEPSPAGGRAVVECEVVVVPGDEFRRLLRDEPSVLRRSLRVIAPVHQGAEAVLREREKLAALGTLSAGLAHELNNPAAAAQRSAADLARALEVLEGTIGRFVASGVEREEAERLVVLQREALAGAAAAAAAGDSMDAADREDALVDLLDARGLAGWRLAPPLAEAGVDAAWVARVEEAAGAALEPALEWVVASLTARGLVRDLHDSAERISAIVAAVKDYTHMDRAETQSIDLRDGLESTLTMLTHKLKRGDVAVVRDYDSDLPRIVAHPSQLNQVWTNLIDNAIDAVDGRGTIRLRTCRAGDEVVVEVIDDGAGVPADLQSRIFEPFFTTKEVGAGTGLGLDIVRRIVENHHGQVRLTSEPGETTFQVRLPIA
jgi:signal transduction histidine kinase